MSLKINDPYIVTLSLVIMLKFVFDKEFAVQLKRYNTVKRENLRASARGHTKQIKVQKGNEHIKLN